MSLEEKVGQLFVSRVYGHSATAPDQADIDTNLRELGVRTAAELLARYRLGGVIYFTWARNTRTPHQIAELSNGIQQASLDLPRGLPVLISTDQEHGTVARVGRPATLFPGAMAVGAGGSRADARTLGRVAGEELRALGIRQDYSPVADVNVNPANPVIGVRSFGADPEAVAGLVAAEAAGYQGAGVAATAKHFPGHGDTEVDSHYGFPVIEHTREQWETIDAPPFRAAIRAGVDSVMTAHIMVPALDPSGDPATLSRPILTGILREELGYDGVVVTDSLGMEGVRTKYGDDRVPVLALRAGVDQLLNPPRLDVAWNAVLAAVRDGELTEERLDTSVLRVLRLKARLGLFEDPYVSARGVDRAVGTGPHLAAADRIAERTTTLLVNEGGLLPLSAREHPRLLVAAPTRPRRPARRARPPASSRPRWANSASPRPRCPPVRHPPRRPSNGPSRRPGTRTRWSWRRTTSRRPTRSARWSSGCWRPGHRWSRWPSATRTTWPSCRACGAIWRPTPGPTWSCGRRPGSSPGRWHRAGSCRCRCSGRTTRRGCCIRSGTG
ncbi:hypothetical protein GCM10020295_53180 [Streptomyces cinereospinus]